MDKIKVLIADDVEVIAKQHKNIALTFDNIEVIGIAKDGKEEYELIMQYKPDLVITDNQMPEKNGIEVIEFVNNSSMEYKPKFILVTGDSSLEFNQKAYNLGTFKVISKMSSESSLKYAIEDYIYLQNTNESDIMDKHQVEKEAIPKKSIFNSLLKKR